MNNHPVYNHPSVELFFNQIKEITTTHDIISYTDYITTESSNSDDVDTVSLMLYDKTVHVPTVHMIISANNSQLGNLSQHNIPQLINSVITDTHIQTLSKTATELAFKYGEKTMSESDMPWSPSLEGTINVDLKFSDNPFQWFLNFFRKNKKTIKINVDLNNLSTIQRRLITKILALSNRIYQGTRRGPANTIIVGGMIGGAIQDNAQFTLEPSQISSSSPLYKVGSIAGMAIYVNSNMRWDDNRILVFRKGSDIEPGLNLHYIASDTTREDILYSGMQEVLDKTDHLDILYSEAISEVGFKPHLNFIVGEIEFPEGVYL